MMRGLCYGSLLAAACLTSPPQPQAPPEPDASADLAPTPTPKPAIKPPPEPPIGEPPTGERMAARRIVIGWSDRPAYDGSSRTHGEATELIETVLADISEGLPFDEAARRWSEAPEAPRGGDIGSFEVPTWPKHVEQALYQAELYSVIGPLDTPVGLALFQRVPCREVYVHLFSWRITGPPDVARARALDGRRALLQGRRPHDADVATETHLGEHQWTQDLSPHAFDLKPGEASEVFAAGTSWHVVWRPPPASVP